MLTPQLSGEMRQISLPLPLLWFKSLWRTHEKVQRGEDGGPMPVLFGGPAVGINRMVWLGDQIQADLLGGTGLKRTQIRRGRGEVLQSNA